LGADNHHIGHSELPRLEKQNPDSSNKGLGPGLIAPRSYAIGCRE
jgi:hypothetical protein